MIKVLIADDSRVIREKIKLLLSGSEFEVIGEASDGEQAVALCELLQPQILTVDINMPKMDGIGVINTLKKNGFDGKIIILTGVTDTKMVKEALISGANSYMIKPFEKDKLFEELRNLAP